MHSSETNLSHFSPKRPGVKNVMAGSQALFSPFWIGPLKLKNRIIGLPVFTGYAYPDGKVSALMIEHYTRLADSGVAMVVVANAAVTSDGLREIKLPPQIKFGFYQRGDEQDIPSADRTR